MVMIFISVLGELSIEGRSFHIFGSAEGVAHHRPIIFLVVRLWGLQRISMSMIVIIRFLFLIHDLHCCILLSRASGFVRRLLRCLFLLFLWVVLFDFLQLSLFRSPSIFLPFFPCLHKITYPCLAASSRGQLEHRYADDAVEEEAKSSDDALYQGVHQLTLCFLHASHLYLSTIVLQRSGDDHEEEEDNVQSKAACARHSTKLLLIGSLLPLPQCILQSSEEANELLNVNIS
mmetsp:Transcript_60939/g.108258  ORF Transcript_60939/g.108258 Transcript_60939/m.108258 type:complete len:232 (-) Transcript_60939:1402-2097(-)